MSIMIIATKLSLIVSNWCPNERGSQPIISRLNDYIGLQKAIVNTKEYFTEYFSFYRKRYNNHSIYYIIQYINTYWRVTIILSVF